MTTLSGGMPVTEPAEQATPAPVSHWTTVPVEVPVEVPVDVAVDVAAEMSAERPAGRPLEQPVGEGPSANAQSASTHWSAEPLWSPDPGSAPEFRPPVESSRFTEPAWSVENGWSPDPGWSTENGQGAAAAPESRWTTDLPVGLTWPSEAGLLANAGQGGSPDATPHLGGPGSADPSWSTQPSWSPDSRWSPEPVWPAEPSVAAEPLWTADPAPTYPPAREPSWNADRAPSRDRSADPVWGDDPLQARPDRPAAAPDAGRQLNVVDLTVLERGPLAAGPATPQDLPQARPAAPSGGRPVRPGPATAATNLTGPIPVAPPVSRRSGDEARTGALRLAAIVEAASSPGAPTARRILSTGPISFDSVDAQDSPFAGPSGAGGAAQPADPGDAGSPRRRSRRAAGEPDQPTRALTTGSADASVSGAGSGFGQRPEPSLGRGPATPAAVAKTGRSGRNLPVAIGVGLLMAVAVVASLLVRKEAFVGLVSAAAVLAVWELATVLTTRRIHIPVIPLAVGALGMLVSAYVAREEGLLISFTLTAFGVLLWRIIDGVEGATRDVAAAVFTAAYVPFMAGFAIVMLAAPDGARRVLIFIAVTVASDVGGYTAGVLFGRHPMAPTISPKKSWEGFTGSVVMCMAVAVAGVIYLLHGPWTAGLAVGAAAAVTATVGDLSESLLKRDLGVKDMGNLLPGHGGMMDRLDSLLLTAPAVYLLLTLLVPSA